jgi:small GTP-binding protein
MHLTDNKVVLIGDSGVGKSTLMLWLLNNKFTPNIQPTIGASFCIKEMVIDNEQIKLHIWDTAGQERFRSVAGMYYKNTSGCICVFDVTDRRSFLSLNYWLIEYEKNNIDKEYAIILVANKCDKNPWLWEVQREEIDYWAEQRNLPIVYTNCLTGENVHNVFNLLAKLIVQIKKDNKNLDKHNFISLHDLKVSETTSSDYCSANTYLEKCF